MSDIRVGWAWAALATMLAGGCVKTHPTMSTTRPDPATQPVPDVSVRVREISRLGEEYGSLSRQLPGRTPQEHRELMAKVFLELGQILPLLQDARNNLVFQQQLSIIAEGRTQLATGSLDLSVEPTIDTGMRATYHALTGIAQNGNYNPSELAPLLDQMSAKIDELDTVHGLTHPVVVAEAVEFSSGIISKMGDELAQRINGEASSTTEPAQTPAPPTEPPTTAPTSAPVEAASPPAPAAAPAEAPAKPAASEPAATASAPADTEPAKKESVPAAAPDPLNK